MVQVNWSEKAERLLFEIAQYIAKDSVEQAIRVSGLIHEATEVLETHPEFGAVVPECGIENIRELRMFHYRIFYRIRETEDEIEILSVYHGSRQLTGDMVE